MQTKHFSRGFDFKIQSRFLRGLPSPSATWKKIRGTILAVNPAFKFSLLDPKSLLQKVVTFPLNLNSVDLAQANTSDFESKGYVLGL